MASIMADLDSGNTNAPATHDRRKMCRDGAGTGSKPQGPPQTTAMGERVGNSGRLGNATMDFETLVQSRRGARLQEQPVSRAVIEDVIEVAKRAPSSMNPALAYPRPDRRSA